MSKRGRKAKPHTVIDGIEHKWCNGCKLWHELADFRENPRTHDRLSSRCSRCLYLKWRERRELRLASPRTPKLNLPAGRTYVVAAHLTNGKRVTPRLYNAWDNMKKRCKGLPMYQRSYGSKGITFCYAWREYAPFRAWAVANGYRKGMTLDRIDNNSGYDPANCRWIPKGQQQENTRRSIRLTHNGVTKSLPVWARELGLDADELRQEVYKGRTLEQVLAASAN